MFFFTGICLVYYGSSFDTMVINRPYGAVSAKYGLFQVNNTWCSDSKSSKKTLCNIKCDDLLSNDIKESVTCAMKIFHTAHFGAWREWKVYCRRNDINELIADCDFLNWRNEFPFVAVYKNYETVSKNCKNQINK